MRWGALLSLGLLLAGCSSEVQYEVGVVTQEIRGVVKAPLEAHPLVIARTSVATFATQGGRPVHQARAKLLYPDAQGRYQLTLDDDVAQVDLYFIAQGYRYAVASFERTLGVRAYLYDVTLKTDPNPKAGYFHGLKPLLSQYITEPRYLMPPKDQMALSQWMDQMEATLYPIKEP